MDEKKEKKSLIDSQFLAGFFYWVRDVVEAADRPIYLTIVIFLPFMASAPPAMITYGSLMKYMEFTQPQAMFSAIALVMLGYSAVIATVASLAEYRDNPENEVAKKAYHLYLSAWIIYLMSLVIANIFMEVEAGSSLTRIAVLAVFTIGLEASAGILNASRITKRDKDDFEERRYQEKRGDRMERFRLKHGLSRQMSFDVNDATNATNVQRDPRFTGDWRKDESLLTQKDLKWLKSAPTEHIRAKYGISGRTAQRWRERASEKIQ